MRTVAIAIFPGVQALDVAGPLDVFAEANGFLPPQDRYALTVLGTTAGPMRASNGLYLAADRIIDPVADRFDTLLVAGGPDLSRGPVDPALADWLRAAAPRCRRYGSICTGAFVVGAAGLLDGRAATTHWQDAPALAVRFPAARVELDRIYLRDGPLVTSAGVTAGIDLCLALVAEDHGAAISLATAKRLVVVAQRQGGQSQFSPYLTLPADDGSPVARVQTHVMQHVAEAHTVASMARVAGMSARNFARVFVQQAKVTPAEFVERARVDTARNLLEGGDLPLKTVAFRSGFGSANRMRLVFVKNMGMTPSQYRASFQSVPL
ncbi:GlxA family transcriptional regulator [Nitrospirillum viridazoti]|uniref:AraC family transcriptional regulator n=1 Tax=Nitrospirillum viridazoti CBAmc TaxID=1441467 RepID=A0A248JVI0_9PROT|nr:GlxA family transcriptional regulator [Nitrospirillum amazonense]ASG22530.1 AraC family transcriptional regulator [Nitrospirillum amazonense CBAmc]TWB42911.1 transcriptional regulator GlxA family with amidase domain [Nitrospirillum amazonense]